MKTPTPTDTAMPVRIGAHQLAAAAAAGVERALAARQQAADGVASSCTELSAEQVASVGGAALAVSSRLMPATWAGGIFGPIGPLGPLTMGTMTY